MEYNKMSSPSVFNQSITTDKGTTFKNNTYLYNQDSQPNTPIQISDMRNTIKKFKFVSIICLLSLFATSCNKPYKTVYYDTGEKQIEYYTAENNNILVKCYYKNGQMSLIGTMDSEGNYIGECTEYYADGLVKYHGKIQSGASSYIYKYNPSIDYTKYIKGIELYGNIINATDTITYVLCRNEIIPIRFLTDSIYPEMFLPLFSIEKGTDLYILPQNSLDKDTYPYMIVTDSLLFNSITIYCLFKDENRKPSFSQPYLKWHFKIEDCND